MRRETRDTTDLLTLDRPAVRGKFPPGHSLRAPFPVDLEDFVARRAEILAPDSYPLVPLDTVGLPEAGPDFARQAKADVEGTFHVYEPDFESLKGVKGNARKAMQAELATNGATYAKYHRPALEYYYLRALYEPGFWMAIQVKKAGARFARGEFVSGTTLGCKVGDEEVYTYGPTVRGHVPGPRVMVVGKQPGYMEAAEQRHTVGAAAETLLRALGDCGVSLDDVSSWYFTSVVKFQPLDPASSALADHWVKDCAPLLYNELCVFRPDYVLCLGAKAAEAVIGKGASVTKLYGRVLEKAVTTHARGTPRSVARFSTMASIDPNYATHRPEAYPDLVNSLGTFAALVSGKRVGDREAGLKHVCVYTEAHLRRVVDAIIAEATPGVPQPIAVDCEWHGRRPGESNAYLRTVQFTHKAGHAWCVVLRHAGGATAFKGGEAAARRELTRLLKSTRGKGNRKVRLGGHYLRADMPWLLALGVDARDEFKVAKSAKGTKARGGWDTATMCHAVMESVEGGYKLENLAARFCGVPRYDTALQAWKDAYCKERDLKDKELDGYGMCPDEVLHPYACWDVDATFRLFEKFNGAGDTVGMLDEDRYKNSSCEAFWMAHKPALAALEMEMTGIEVDRTRGDTLTQLFMEALDVRTKELQDLIGWPGFNPWSVDQMREFLFGKYLNGKVDANGNPVRLRPRGAMALGLTPLKVSGDSKKTWERVVQGGLVGVFNASTDKETTGILSYDRTPVIAKDPARTPTTKGDLVGKVRDIKFTGQVLSGVLRRPFEMGGRYVRDEDDDLTYDGGLLYWIGEDGRVRTHFGLVETGRWSSWLPNLQNISSRREDDYKRILKERYLYPIRSMLRARPGHVLVEADYKMAEMAMIGWLAQDPAMMDVVRRNMLPESDPDFVDPHSLTAIKAFKLDNAENHAKLDAYNAANGATIKFGANKDCLSAIGKKSLRVAAKNVNFGVPYGRSAEAIARQCREEGADVSVADAQMLIDEYYATYPQIARFLAECKGRVVTPGWICGTAGRYRRFPAAVDQEKVADLERQALNYPIQNGVAEAINEACHNLYEHRASLHRAGETRTFAMCLQIHDALLFEVPVADVAWFVDDVLPLCMRDMVEIWPRDLGGARLPGVGPYKLDIDCKVHVHWGEKIDPTWAESVGLPEVTPGKVKIYKAAKVAA